MAQNLKSGDKVTVISGGFKGQSGKIIKMDRKNHKAFVEGLGVRERHIRASRLNPKGTKKTVHAGIDLSNLKKEEK